MKSPWKIMFYCLLMAGTFITISSSSWMMVWVGLEINMMALMPILMKTSSSREAESSLKYFLVQALASSIFISSVLVCSFFSGFFSMNNLFMILIITSFLIKAGSAPFHLWVPQVIEGLSWFNCGIILIWQKIPPMILIFSCLKSIASFPNLMILMNLSIFLSASIGALSGLSQTSNRKILAYSSINHISWMLLAISFSFFSWILYYFFYSTVLILIMIFFYKNNMNSISKQSKKMNYNNLILFVSLMSLGGLPPFLGFIPKLIVITQTLETSPMMLMFLLGMSLLTLFFYLRISFSSMMMKSLTMFKESDNNFSKEMISNISINMTLPLIIIMVFSFF